ncbi:hypothetical protein [Roseibium sp.]|uniref:hypothetical protein n=1 Tax=Roseibium sp. TaxID=1936156 RepID=UPI003BAD73C1
MSVSTRVENHEVMISVGRSIRVMVSPKFRKELHRGVIDTGRKTKTRVQKAVYLQMGLKSGRYQKSVVAHTRGVPREASLSYEIFSVRRGAPIEEYKGLRSVKSGGDAFKRMNASRSALETGTVRSGVWNVPRVFKRSFETNGKFKAFRPASAGTSSTAPRALWTFGRKVGQPRDGSGRFMSTGKRYGKIRSLYGPALRDEIPQGDSLQTFQTYAPRELEIQVTKRLEKIMRY